jgi:hypothetical protein
MYTDMVPKISWQLRIGSVYLERQRKIVTDIIKCQFLIGNVYHSLSSEINRIFSCQFLIGNVYLILLGTILTAKGIVSDRVNSL